MKKLAFLTALALLSGTALAADNIAITQGSGTTLKTKDVGAGVEESQVLLSDSAGVSILGTAGTANANVLSVQGIASMTPFLSAQSGTWNITNISGAVSLPTGAATSALQSTINTTLGSPFQAGGSIGNTGFNVTGTLPAFAATPTFNLGTLNGAALASNQTGGGQKTQIVDGSGNVIASTSNNLNVQCANCSGSGVSSADGAAFTAGASLFAGTGGFFQTTATSNPLTTGQQGMFQVTAQRALFSNLRNASGAEVGVAAAPLQVSLANTAANGTNVNVNCQVGCSSAAAVAPVVAGSASSSAVLKASAGSLIDGYVVPTVSGFLMVFNSTSAPGDGATTAGIASGNLQDCIPAAANVATPISTGGTGPETFTVGITVVFSSTGCATKTASATAFIHGRAQ